MFTMKKYRIKAASAFVLITLFSCEGIFIPDPIDPRLPRYTHQGNNVAGALIDDKRWESIVTWTGGLQYTADEPVFRSYPNDRLEIVFSGNVGGETYRLTFNLVGYGIHSYEDLIKLRGLKIQLTGDLNSAEIEATMATCDVHDGGVGQFYAKNISMKENGVLIFSGTFGFVTTEASCPPAEVTYGRFDYAVNATHFTVIPE